MVGLWSDWGSQWRRDGMCRDVESAHAETAAQRRAWGQEIADIKKFAQQREVEIREDLLQRLREAEGRERALGGRLQTAEHRVHEMQVGLAVA